MFGLEVVDVATMGDVVVIFRFSSGFFETLIFSFFLFDYSRVSLSEQENKPRQRVFLSATRRFCEACF